MRKSPALKPFLIAAAAVAATALPASAQEAPVDINGYLYCTTDGVDLRYKDGAGFKVTLIFEHRGDAANAVYPAGGAKLFGPQDELRAYVSINYSFTLDAEGNPASRPHPSRLSASTGRFAGMRLEPFESLTLQLRAGDTLSDPIGLNSAYYTIALVGGEVGLPGSDNPYDTEWPQPKLDEIIQVFETRQRWIVLSQYGREVARIPVPEINITAKRDSMIAWVRKTTPLMKQHKCG